ncbi:carboxylesterase type B [Streptomyces netropsis]|uniref:Carboxylesterase type B n=1 Tax=Streptomyces netropsis TaxID=55404 RepID=A0A7W7LI74_STRNE|nr:carboxylesterase type B [Streptomyces netropsis]
MSRSFGQSAGAGSVAALLAMPRAAGLFGRAVAQSVQGTFFSPELTADITTSCAAELGLRPTVAELSTVAPASLSAAGDAVGAKMARWAERWGQVAHKPIPFSPVVEGDALPVTPWQALADGVGRDIDLLVGHTRDEQRLLTAFDGLLGQVTQEQAARACAPSAPAGTAHAVTSTAFRPRARTSCTNWSTPTGCSACRPFTWPRPGPPPAAVPTSRN